MYFGDKRLNNRFSVILDSLSSSYGSIPNSMSDMYQTKAFYRFVNHKKVDSTKIEASYEASSLGSPFFLENKTILGIQDTSELLYTGNRSAKNLDCLDQTYMKGFFMDTLLLASSEGIPEGFSRIEFYNRKEADLGKGKTAKQRKRPSKEKESYRWLSGFKRFSSYFEAYPAKEGIYIADREADMSSIFEASTQPNVHFIIRSKHDRNLLGGEKLYKTLSEQPSQGSRKVLIREAKGKERMAELNIRFMPIQFCSSRNKKNSQVLYAVEAQEIDAPKGVKPISWRLISDMKVENLQTAERVLDFYVMRWLIERFFYVLKEGFLKVEDLQIEEAEALKNALVLKAYQALTIMNLHTRGSKRTQQGLLSCDFEQKEMIWPTPT